MVACSFVASMPAAQPPRAPAPKFDDRNAPAYRITRGDVLSVAVFDEPSLTIGGKKVETRGTINLQLIQDIRIVGLSMAEAKAAIETAYRDGRFLRNPEVTVSIEQYAQRMVQISGQVNQPARYDLPPDQPTSVKDLVGRAGGFSPTAKGTEVRILRTMPDGTLKTFIKDVESFLRGKANAKPEEANFLLEPDDVIYVPERII